MRAHEVDPLDEARGSRKLARGQTDDSLVRVVEEPVAEVVQPRHIVGEPAAPVPGEGDLRQQRLGCAPTAPQHSREGERAFQERDAVQAAEVDRADLAILVELERRGDVRRLPEGHADGADAFADRQLAPGALAPQHQQLLERLLSCEDVRISVARRSMPRQIAAAASCPASALRQTSARSPPAARNRRAAPATPQVLATAAISRSSLRTRPEKPRRRRSRPPMTSAESDAGRAGSRTRYRTWATITAGQPAPRAARNGTRSQRSSSSMVASTSGKARCESTEVRPCPGKCLATGTSPSESRASTNATPHAAMISGAVPNARSSITVFAGLSRQSSTGASPESNPAARSSRAIALATATAR